MTVSFNLLDQPWLPCLMTSGEMRLLSLKAVLLQPKEVIAVADESPMVTITLHRLLLATLHAALDGPKTQQVWLDWWQQGCWPIEPVEAYLEKPERSSRFDLFDAQHPFCQEPSVPFEEPDPKKPEKSKYRTATIARLDPAFASGNNDTLFDHTLDDQPPEVDLALAARLLVAYQATCAVNRVTYFNGEDWNLEGSADAAPLVKCAVCLLRGKKLAETLLLNMVRYEPESTRGDPDCPAWDNDHCVQPADRRPRGYVDFLTWQSRRIRLYAETGGTRPFVCRVVIAKGFQFPDDLDRRSLETMVAFEARRNAKSEQEPFVPVGLQLERALWRDSLALVQSVEGQRQRPKILDELSARRRASSTLPDTIPVDVFGLCSDQAKIEFWRHEQVRLPLVYLEDELLVEQLQIGLEVAEKAGEILWETVLTFARRRLEPNTQGKLSTEREKDAKNFADSLAPMRRYWPRLQTPFFLLLEELPGDPGWDEAAQEAHQHQQLVNWAKTVRQVASQAFEEATNMADQSARQLKAVVVARRSLDGKLRRLLSDSHLQPQEVTDGIPTNT